MFICRVFRALIHANYGDVVNPAIKWSLVKSFITSLRFVIIAYPAFNKTYKYSIIDCLFLPMKL